MRVRKPSTCGWMVVERRDFTVPMNSVASSTGLVASVTTSTPIAGMPPPAARPAPPPAARASAGGEDEAGEGDRD